MHFIKFKTRVKTSNVTTFQILLTDLWCSLKTDRAMFPKNIFSKLRMIVSAIVTNIVK